MDQITKAMQTQAVQGQLEAANPPIDPASAIFAPEIGSRGMWFDDVGHPHFGVVVQSMPQLIRIVEFSGTHPTSMPDQVPCLWFKIDECGRYVQASYERKPLSEAEFQPTRGLDMWTNVYYPQPDS